MTSTPSLSSEPSPISMTYVYCGIPTQGPPSNGHPPLRHEGRLGEDIELADRKKRVWPIRERSEEEMKVPNLRKAKGRNEVSLHGYLTLFTGEADGFYVQIESEFRNIRRSSKWVMALMTVKGSRSFWVILAVTL